MAFPEIIDPNSPVGTDSPGFGDDEFRALKQFVVDVFGAPASPLNISGPASLMDTNGQWPTHVRLINATGGPLNAGDVVALDTASDASVIQDDVVASLNVFLVVRDSVIAPGFEGLLASAGVVTALASGAIARGDFVIKSATAKAVETAGVQVGLTPPNGTLGVALAAAAGGFVQVLWLPMISAATAAPPGSTVELNGRLILSVPNLVFQPYNGNRINISGTNEIIPAGGVILGPPGGIAANYYIYAFMNLGVMTLERSTTGYVTSAATGVAVKSGDATRTLVGFARGGFGAWGGDLYFVRSWMNEEGKVAETGFSADFTPPNTGIYLPIRSLGFLSWAGEYLSVQVGGAWKKNAGGNVRATIFVDHTVQLGVFDLTTSLTKTSLSMHLMIRDLRGIGPMPEGLHSVQLAHRENDANTATFFGATGGDDDAVTMRLALSRSGST